MGVVEFVVIRLDDCNRAVDVMDEVIGFGEVRLRHHHFERIMYIDYVSGPLIGE